METNTSFYHNLIQEDHLFSQLDDLHIGVYLFDSTGKTLFTNLYFQNMLGYTLEELKLKSLSDLFNPPDVQLFMENNETSHKELFTAKKKDNSSLSLLLLSKKKRENSITVLTFLNMGQRAETNVISAMTVSDLNDLKYALDQTATVSISDRSGRIIYVNDKFCEICKYDREELIGQNHRVIKSGYHSKEFYRGLWETLSNGEVWRNEICNKAKDGTLWWGNATIIPLMDEDNKPYRYIGIRQDVTEQKMAEQKIKLENEIISFSERKFRSLVQNSNDIILILDHRGMIQYASSNTEEIIGYSEDELLKKTIYQFISDHELPELKLFFESSLRHSGKPIKTEIRGICKGGTWRDFSLIFNNLLHDDAVNGVAVNLRDISETKEAQQKIYQMAYYDFLTELPNRRSFESQIEEEFLQAQQTMSSFSLMILDIHGLKFVNDSLNTEIGDKLLQQAANSLNHLVDLLGTLYRIDGNEFAIVLPHVSEEHLLKIADQILLLLNQPFSVGEYELFLTVNIGMCMFPDGGKNIHSFVRSAYTALHESRTKGRNVFKLYSQNMNKGSTKTFILKNDIRKALKYHELFLNFQPRVDPRCNKIIGAEALIRWKHPKLGIISPVDFIPLAEEEGIIGKIGEWVLFTACLQNKKWQDAGLSPIVISVNYSVIQFLQSDMIHSVERILAITDLDPQYLEIEITETAMMKDESLVSSKIDKLRTMGIKTAIDDFGTGYASLSYLKKLRTNTLKIDKSFINGIPAESVSSEIVSSIIQLAKKLNIRVVAEGVETVDQLDLLKEIKCDEIQGYLYSKPLNIKDFENLLVKEVVLPS